MQNSYDTLDEVLHGSDPLRANPLSLAHAMSAFSNSGLVPSVEILSAVNTHKQGWVFVEDQSQRRIIREESANFISGLLQSQEIPGWEISARGSDSKGTVSWYAAGSDPNWDVTPFVIVLVLEEDNPVSANRLGREITSHIVSY